MTTWITLQLDFNALPDSATLSVDVIDHKDIPDLVTPVISNPGDLMLIHRVMASRGLMAAPVRQPTYGPTDHIYLVTHQGHRATVRKIAMIA